MKNATTSVPVPRRELAQSTARTTPVRTWFSWSSGRLLATTAAVATLMVITGAKAGATLLFNENFSYTAGTQLNTQGGWTAHSAPGTNAQTIGAGSLSYPSYPSSGIGNMLGPTATSGEDDNHPFAAVTTGSVYAAFLVNVVSAQTTGDYFFHFFDGAITLNSFYGRVFVKKDAASANYAYGLQFKSNTGGTCTVYTGFSYAPGTTHLIVVKYLYAGGSNVNDLVNLFIDPVISCGEPTPNLTAKDPGTAPPGCSGATDADATGIDGVASRQGSGTAAPSVTIDGIRVADNWQDLMGVPAPVATTTVLSQDPAKTNCGEKVVFTATVSPAGATGTVTFFDGVESIGSSPVDAMGNASISVSNLGAGSHTIGAQYTSNSSCYTSSTSNTVVHEVNPAPSTVNLTQDPPKTNCGEKVVFTAQVSPAGATGTVTFLSDGNPIGSAPVDASGSASISVSDLSAGAHSITAQYSGDPCHTPSESNKIVHEVNPIPTTLDLTQDPAKTNCGEKVVFTAHVLPPGGTGVVQFLDGANPLGPPVPVDPMGNAQLSVSDLSAGIHSITAKYSGDACHAPSESNKITHEVNPIPTTVDLTQDPAKTNCGEKVVFTAKVSDPAATGTVQFVDGTSALGPPVPVGPGGIAQLSVSDLTPGPHSITAKYSGDPCHTSAVSNKVEHEVNPIPTTVDLTQDPAKTNCGEKVVFTAKVSPAGATGTVTFLDGTTAIGTGTVDATGTATLSISTLGVGTHSITAVYGGDGCHGSSTSNKVDHEVNAIPTTTQLTSSPNPSDEGAKVTLTATVTPGDATGDVNFFDGPTEIGSAPLVGGQASLSETGFAVGVHSLTAVYKGDNCHPEASTSNKVDQVVVPPVATQLMLFDSGNADDGSVELRWQFADQGQVASTSVQRAADASGPWSTVEVERRDEGGVVVAIDRSTAPNTTYFYRLVTQMRDGRSQTFGPIEATSADRIAGFALVKLSPNPTGGPTVMEYTVAQAAKVSLSIVDLQGRVVARLVNGVQPAGRYHVTWSGTSETGTLSQGAYFVRYQAAGHSSLKRLVLAR